MHVVCNMCNEHCCKSIIFSDLMDLLLIVKLCKFLYKEIYCTFHSFVSPKYIFLIMYSLVVTLIVYLFTMLCHSCSDMLLCQDSFHQQMHPFIKHIIC